MDVMPVLIVAVLVFGFWILLSRRIEDVETDLEALSKAIGKEDLLTKIH